MLEHLWREYPVIIWMNNFIWLSNGKISLINMGITVILFIKIIRLDLIIFIKITELVQSIDFILSNNNLW